MSNTLPQRGVIRIASNSQLAAREEEERKVKRDADEAARSAQLQGLVGYIRSRYDVMRVHRANTQSGWDHRLLAAMRAFNGEYDPQKLAEVRQFGGSEIYARMTAMKCRGASSLLRDVYLTNERAWGIDPAPDPDVPPNIVQAIISLANSEMAALQQQGMPVDPTMIRDRIFGLMKAARDASKKRAKDQAKVAQDKIDEILNEGDFYRAISEFIQDLPLFPFACLKGPTVRIVQTVKWKQGQPVITNVPRLIWSRVSPFDLFWTPGISRIEDAEIIERSRVTRADLNDLLDIPGYNTEAVRQCLADYGSGGLYDNWDQTDAARAILERRENPHLNRSGLISMLEFHGNVQGSMLAGYNLPGVTDPLRDYMVQAWIIDRHVLKVQLSPSPRKRHPYYITSFEKVPGTPVGNALPDILADVQEMANASLRSLANNLSMSSGPQVVVNDDRIAIGADADEMYPWKRWHVTNDPLTNSTQKPVEFFQPQSNAHEHLGVYKEMMAIADDLSAIPKYLAGGAAGSGAGRTASGLAMLMGNASKMLQTVCANIDRDVYEPALMGLYDMIMMTDETGMLTGDEKVRILGVQVAVQRETQRARQLEFLGITANPMDAQIMGPKGRATVLRSVADTIGISGAQVVPSEDELETQQKAAAAKAAQQNIPGHAGLGEKAADAQGGQTPQGGQASGDVGPRTNISGGSQ
jgi:hypothetical protein